MDNTVCDPSLLFISEEEWLHEEMRDKFLSLLLSHLQEIDRYRLTRLYWSHELEAYLWTHPQLPPWRRDRDWRVRLVPIIVRLFNANRTILEGCEAVDVCAVEPGMNWKGSVTKAGPCFLCLMHLVMQRSETVFLCLGTGNLGVGPEGFRFRCDCHGPNLKPVLVKDPADWVGHVRPEIDLWPANHEEAARFEEAIKLTAKRRLGKGEGDLLYRIQMGPEWMADVVAVNAQRRELLGALAKRLIKSQAQATRDHGLKDEPVRGDAGVRRFRVTKETRVHYRYTDRATIKLLRFYDAGEHDAGL